MSDPYTEMAKTTEEKLPGFWAFFKARHPECRGLGEPDGPPIGAMLMPLCQQWGDAITAYVAEYGAAKP